jgi:ABC-type dipeptide/oligopeptide/nickel transport system permease component
VALRDIPLVQALAVLIAVLYIAVNIATDLVVVLLVPKLRTAGVQ